MERIESVFDDFENVYFSFSAGKDSGVMVQMALEIAKKKNRLPLNVLFIDLEAQYKATIDHATEILLRDDIKAYWICLPMNLRNAVSAFQPQWICWDPKEKGKWVREMPTYDCVINDEKYFPFFRFGMEFEEFIVEFAKWLKSKNDDKKTACMVAIRADESLNRFRTIKSMKKTRYKNLGYSTKLDEGIYNFYPLYDWKTEDIWTVIGKFGWPYNKIYDFMYMQGKSIHESRICQPYGDDQRKGLDLFRKCEPETWARVVNRVSGSNFGNIYCNSFLLGNRKIILPEGHTWKSYAEFLLDTMPKYEAEWYKGKFKVFFEWWEKHGYAIDKVPDKADPKLEAHKKFPSWRRIVKCIMKNDKLCKSLSFGQTKYQYNKYMQLREMYGE
ncbi:MAG: DUF3440 domain-containing protein [Nanoarchaeota archaeon]